MKILVIGLEGAAAEILFEDERLTNLRRLMEGGCYGRLESVTPPVGVIGWKCMATSQDPGSIGIYDSRSRIDYSSRGREGVDGEVTHETTIWNYLGEKGKHSILAGVPDAGTAKEKTTQIIDGYTTDSKELHCAGEGLFREKVYASSHKRFEAVKHHLENSEWDYFQLIDSGPERLQHRFWRLHDPQHVRYETGNPYQTLIRDYYAYLDDEIGKLLERLYEDTVILVVSDHGPGKVGYQTVFPQVNADPQDYCNHTTSGCFILASPNNPLQGEIEDVSLLDMAPTLLEMGGYDIPDFMQGKSLVAGKMLGAANDASDASDEEAIRKRLRGLGYI